MSLSLKVFAASFAVLFSCPAAQAQRRARVARPAAPPAAINLTAQDMALIVEGLQLPPDVQAKLASDEAERRKFAKDVREMLSVAEEAKAAGYAARPELKLQAELSRAFVIAKAYFKLREADGAKTSEEVVTQAEIDALLQEPASAPLLEAFLEDYRKNGPGRGAALTDEQRAQLRNHWGRVMVARRKGVAAGLDRERKTQLAVMLQQSRLLAGAYSKDLGERSKATDAEVAAYLASHPELNSTKEREKIEGILGRVRAGEDFAKLADEFTEDPSGKGKGGDLGWFSRGMMVAPFEAAAFALKPGEVSGVVETLFGFHIIKLEDRKTDAGAGGKAEESVRARHILIGYNAALRSPGGRRQSPAEHARSAVEKQKIDRAIAEIIARRGVRVAETFTVGETGAAPPGGDAQTPAAGAKTTTARPTATGRKPARRKN
ncbi:MAG TPA: peptidylprolyl isomerase [Pyrinomonadaceae bacterium]|nr:peptidylprolyl isomerase [Pyrinomonadaceae bacterium]